MACRHHEQLRLPLSGGVTLNSSPRGRGKSSGRLELPGWRLSPSDAALVHRVDRLLAQQNVALPPCKPFRG